MAERVARLPVDQREAWLNAQTPQVLEEMARGEWWWVARPEQIPPPGDWLVHLALAGRGWGKSRAGAEWIVDQTQITRRPTRATPRDGLAKRSRHPTADKYRWDLASWSVARSSNVQRPSRCDLPDTTISSEGAAMPTWRGYNAAGGGWRSRRGGEFCKRRGRSLSKGTVGVCSHSCWMATGVHARKNGSTWPAWMFDRTGR